MAGKLALFCVILVISILQDVVLTQDWSESGSDWTTSGWTTSGWHSSGSGDWTTPWWWHGSGSGSGSGSGGGSGWYDGNGVWHPDESSGWFDGNGVWHPDESSGKHGGDDDDHHSKKHGLIIGAFVFGGLITLGVILAVTLCIVHAKKQKHRVAQDQSMTTAYNMQTMPTAPAYPRQPQPLAPPAYNSLSVAELGKAPAYDNMRNDAKAPLEANSLSNTVPAPLTVNMSPPYPAGTLPPIQHSQQLNQPMYGQGMAAAPLPPIVQHFETPEINNLYN